MKKDIKELIKERIVIIDGALGTELQKFEIPAEAWLYNGEDKEGCNELLCVTAPDVVRTIHKNYVKAGADMISTNSFGSFPWVLDEYQMADESYNLSKASAELVAEAIAEVNPDAYVLGSIGPGTKLPSLGHITYDEMYEGYQVCVEGLIDGGTDVFLLETCQDPLQIKAGINAINTVLEKRDLQIPIMVSVTIETTGAMLIGTDAETIATILEPFDILSLGFNCGSGPSEVMRHVATLSENWDRAISVHSNAGLPINQGGCTVYPMEADEFSKLEDDFITYDGVSFLGGCCGTTPAHIEALANKVKGRVPQLSKKAQGAQKVASLFGTVDLKQNPAPLLMGERSNATGSKAFRELLLAEDYEEALKVANDQIKAGAHVLDVNVGFAGRDEKKDMTEVVTRYSTLPTPLMPDSTQLDGLETALKLIGGKPIINSVNLEDGEERFAQVCKLAKKYGGTLICLAIDEVGMAKTKEKKVEIADRMFKLATEKHGINPKDIIFDLLTFTIGSGDEEYYTAGMELIEAIREVQIMHPEVGTTLGLSNISFGLGKDARIFLNSIFLHHCIEAGLTSAIVNVKHILPMNKISDADKKACDDLIYNRRTADYDPLFAFIEHFKDATAEVHTVSDEEFNKLPDEEKIKSLLMDGEKDRLIELVSTVKETIPAEVIVNEILIDGMKIIGELFGSGEMQLPFVLQSAETMKKTVDYLNPFLPKKEKATQTTVVLGTVKGDVHDVGKNLVDIILTNNGFKVINIGIKVGIEEFLKQAKEHNADVIGMSGLLVKSTNEMKNNLIEMKKLGMDIPIMLGGAALSKSFVDDFCRNEYDGPIFYCRDAFDGITAMGRIEKGGELDVWLDADKRFQEFEAQGVVKEKPAYREIPDEEVVYPENFDKVEAPFYGVKEFVIGRDVDKETLFSWLNKTVLYRARWGYAEKDPVKYEKMLKEKIEPKFEELKKLFIEGDFFKPISLYGFFKCRSHKGELIITHEGEEFKLKFPRQQKTPYRSLADYYSPDGDDVIALTLASAGHNLQEFEQEVFKRGDYTDYHLIHAMAVELAEALAEVVHKKVRVELGILENETADLNDVNMRSYQGKRYSPGYPACPDLEMNKTIFDLLKPETVGIELSETFQMHPEATTVAIVAHHKDAVYYAV